MYEWNFLCSSAAYKMLYCLEGKASTLASKNGNDFDDCPTGKLEVANLVSSVN